MFTIATSVDRNSTRFVYEISQERASGLPTWEQQAASEPPLSISEARKTAETWLMSRTPEVKTFELNALSLSRTPAPPGTCRGGGCWYYRLTFDPVIAGRRLPGAGDFTVIVLIDGSIVEPRIEAAPSGTNRGGGPGGGVGSGIGGGGGPRPGPVPRPDAAGVYTAGNGVIPPRVVRQTRVSYTPDAMRAKIQGAVWLDVVVNTDGTVGAVKVAKSLDAVYGLDKEAVKTVKEWRFAPGTRDGVPVPVRVMVELTFSFQ
jgi:TonB family protein